MSSRLIAPKALEPAGKVIHAALQDWGRGSMSRAGGNRQVFVTISRQPGAGAVPFSHRLAERLHEDFRRGPEWSVWDHELIERVAAEEGISQRLIELIEERPHSWLTELLESFSSSHGMQHAAELHLYKRVAMTIRALAQAGHAIIVGQGSRFVTAHMTGGIHLRLVAPVDFRVKCMAENLQLTLREAADRVDELDHNRVRFFARYWPGKSLAPEMFTMTLNSAEMSMDEMVDCVVPLISGREAATKRTSAASRGAVLASH